MALIECARRITLVVPLSEPNFFQITARGQRNTFQCSLPNGRNLSAGEIDAWGLKAARRGLRNLETLLEGQPMLDLLAEQIEEGDAYFKRITSCQFVEWFIGMDAKGTSEGTRRPYLDMMAPAHPEHYSLGPYPLGIVETVLDLVLEYGDPAYDKKLVVTWSLEDRTTFFYSFQEFPDREDGLNLRMRIIFPAASPQILFDEHNEHLAIEFKSFIKVAYERLHG
ncbi:hypothetical protein BDV39DRAFT_198349 [Aspergillus sergii]|uniref:Uncharacterized protein n=1 Tax=Aspergillus sergii TaxID=1034303 RepID=A0A5N6WIA8_9EURO|nr:hypothetical protein BDV39DRAFT_198349 [Aspergillus sergii]